MVEYRKKMPINLTNSILPFKPGDFVLVKIILTTMSKNSGAHMGWAS